MSRLTALLRHTTLILLATMWLQEISLAESYLDETDSANFGFNESDIEDLDLGEFDLSKAGMEESNMGPCTDKEMLDYVEMRMTMAEHQDDIYTAYTLFSQANPGYGGQLEFDISISPSGIVKHVDVKEGLALPFSNAIKKKVATINFPSCAKPSQFKYTMYLGPDIETLVDPTLNTCLSPQEIQKTIDLRSTDIVTVYKDALKSQPKLEGTVEYRFSIFPSGNTESVTINRGQELAFANTVKRILLSLSFPSCDQVTLVTVPIRFLPSPQNSVF